MSKNNSLRYMLLCGLFAWAQGGVAVAAPAGVVPVKVADDRGARVVQQQRRDGLRDALRAQRTGVDMPPAAPAGNRQLSPAERAELRQQLRQQRHTPNKGTL